MNLYIDLLLFDTDSPSLIPLKYWKTPIHLLFGKFNPTFTKGTSENLLSNYGAPVFLFDCGERLQFQHMSAVCFRRNSRSLRSLVDTVTEEFDISLSADLCGLYPQDLYMYEYLNLLFIF